MTQLGCDSASTPSPSQVQAAAQAGVTWWGFYLQGPGAYHDWPASGIDDLRQGGLTRGLPIYVPALASGRIASQTPEADANAFVAAYRSLGVTGAGALDTEASMRGDPWTATYESRFAAELRALGERDVTYAGGFTLSAPPSATYRWWIAVGTSPAAGTCSQEGQATYDGVTVDLDYAADDFPLASLTDPAPTPVRPAMLNAPVIAAIGRPQGDGYWLFAMDGGVFNFGAAPFYGSMGGKPLNRPVVTAVVSPTGEGYMLVASDGGTFCFGDFAYQGSVPGDNIGAAPLQTWEF